jgi:large subunit ribosomal protein L3
VIRHSGPTPSNPLHSLQIGSSDKPARTTTAQLLGHFRKAGTNPKYQMKEYSVTPDAILSVGTELNAGHFVPGQYVDVTATSYVS